MGAGKWVKCLICKDKIISRHRHDFVFCACESVAVDGGDSYTKIMGEAKNWEFVEETPK